MATNIPKRLKNYLCNKMSLVRDLWYFMKERKKFILLPVIIILLLLGALLILGGSSAIAPFIYTLF